MKHVKSLEVRLYNKTVGHLALTSDGLCAFEYSHEWLATGFAISPFELPLRSGVFIAKSSPFEGGFGVFDDCLPDGWGMLIMDRFLQQKGINPQTLTLLDRLSLVGLNGRGALEFYPDFSEFEDDEAVDFNQLNKAVEAILDDRTYSGNGIGELYRRGGSPGGARPKIFVKYDDAEWLVKFRAKEDPKNIGKQEFHYAEIAKACGLKMMDCRLFEEQFFGTKRFDRTDSGEKIHVVSMAGLLCADYRIPCIDYLHVFQVASELTHNMAELWNTYRLMCFNYLINNKDDHAKNFAFLCKNGNWHFAPAFDLLPSEGMNGFHTTSFNNSITPNDTNLIELAKRVGLNEKEAKETLNTMRLIVSNKKQDIGC